MGWLACFQKKMFYFLFLCICDLFPPQHNSNSSDYSCYQNRGVKIAIPPLSVQRTSLSISSAVCHLDSSRLHDPEWVAWIKSSLVRIFCFVSSAPFLSAVDHRERARVTTARFSSRLMRVCARSWWMTNRHWPERISTKVMTSHTH